MAYVDLALSYKYNMEGQVMNYSLIYQDLINRAKTRDLDMNVIYEKHHILPKSLGGSDEPSNLVKLTLREHFIAHRLLVKIHRNDQQNYAKMSYALWWMCKTKMQQDSSLVNSHAYQVARTQFIQNSPMRDTLRKIKVANNRKAGIYNYNYNQVSESLKKTLGEMSKVQMKTRIDKSLGKADVKKRGESIRRSKASQFRITNLDGSIQEFWSYEDVYAITGVTYSVILTRLRLHDGLLVDGRKVECLKKFDKSNNKKARSKLLLERPDGTQLIFDPSEDVKALTGISLCTLRNRISRKGGLLSDGSRVSYIQKYNRQKQ